MILNYVLVKNLNRIYLENRIKEKKEKMYGVIYVLVERKFTNN